jgi:predicted enzyme related to lactoylglutathione lyase
MLPVKDPVRARAFYEKTFGLSVGKHSDDGVWTEYDLPGGGCLALYASAQARPSGDTGATVALEVEDLDALVARLKGESVAFMNEDIESPVCRMAVVLDSEGNGLILHELKR